MYNQFVMYCSYATQQIHSVSLLITDDNWYIENKHKIAYELRLTDFNHGETI